MQNGTLDGAVVAGLVKFVTKPVGDIFLNLLFMAIIPLVFASLAVGVTRLGGGGNVGRVGVKTVAYFLVTTACAAAIGLSLVNAVRPGDRVPPEQKEKLKAKYADEAGEHLEKKDEFVRVHAIQGLVVSASGLASPPAFQRRDRSLRR